MTTNPRHIGGAISIALHVLGAAALLSYEPARTALLSAAPVMVSLIAAPAPPSKPPEVPPRPKPAVKAVPKPPDPAPLIIAPAESPSPSPIVAPPPPPPPPAEPAPVVSAPPLVVTAPIFDADYLENPAPHYPIASRRGGEQGRVVLRVLVNPGGSADEIQIRTSSGFVRLDEAARDTVRRWRFVPAKRGDEAVAAWVLIPILFRLEGN